MNWADFEKLVIAAATRVGLNDPLERAFMLAMCRQESKREDGPSHLAAVYNNLFGHKYLVGRDEGRYRRIDMARNQFEGSGARIAYRAYDSLEHSIAVWRLNIVQNPEAYAYAKERAFRTWVEAVADLWVDGKIGVDEINPNHRVEVLQLFDDYARKAKA